MRDWREKHLLKRSQIGYLAANLLNRTKKGFSAPIARWLAGRLKGRARVATFEGPLTDRAEPRAVQSLWSRRPPRRCDNSPKSSGLACLGLWLQDLAAAPVAVSTAGAA